MIEFHYFQNILLHINTIIKKKKEQANLNVSE